MTRDRSKDRPKTAAELMAELAKDPGFAARAQERERARQAGAEAYAREAAPVLQALRKAGLQVTSIAELKTLGEAGRPAVPVLLQWLARVDHPPLKEEMVRALSVPWAAPEAAPFLIEAFTRAEDDTGSGLRWAIGNALAVVADDTVFDDVARLACDKRYGKAREMLTVALGNMTRPESVPVLLELLEDDQVVGHAVMALGKLEAATARERIAVLKEHPRSWVRQEVRKALTRIDKAHKAAR